MFPKSILCLIVELCTRFTLFNWGASVGSVIRINPKMDMLVRTFVAPQKLVAFFTKYSPGSAQTLKPSSVTIFLHIHFRVNLDIISKFVSKVTSKFIS